MDTKNAYKVYKSLNDEQKEFVHNLVSAAKELNEIKDADAYLISTQKDKHIRIRLMCEGEEVIDIASAIIESITQRLDCDFEEMITALRVWHYSRVQDDEEDE